MDKLEDFQENYGNGWIKLYRSIKNHWLLEKNRPLTFFEAWTFILLEVNHSGQELRIGYEVLKCQRGESLNSLDTWAKLFNWHKSKVRRFFKLLEKDSMVELKKCKKSTHLRVCNYDIYQGERNASETQVKRRRNASETDVTPNKNDKNVNKGKKDYISPKTFYDSELSLVDCDNKIMGYYAKFVDILFGKNELERELTELLNLESQVSYNQFSKLYKKSIDKGKKFSQILPTMTNDPKYYKKKKSLYLCLNTWLNNDFK
jgi:hypothetical protein